MRLYSPPPGAAQRGVVADDAPQQLANIKRRLRDGEGGDMQKIFPEGWFFSHALYGMAWINVGMQSGDAAVKKRAAEEARWVLERMESAEGLAPFTRSTQVRNGVFYLGWKNRLLGGLLALNPEPSPTPAEVAAFLRQSEELGAAFRSHPTRHLDAYPGLAWPCDNVMALASLRLHDTLYAPKFADVISAWVEFTKAHLDSATGLIVHEIDGHTGAMRASARASTQVYIHALLPELDTGFAREQYTGFRRLFVEDWLGYLPVREYPKGQSGPGDVDTGPLIFGISPSATVVSIAAARANGDWELAERNVILSETIGFPWTTSGEKSFGFGAIVVADAFLVWGKTFVPWTPTAAADFPPTTSRWWKWRIHGISLALLGALIAIILRRRKPVPVQ
ncbi:MAG: hypothetical protein ACKO2G_05750 [Verrucomicrobiales bacterium]